MKEPCVARKEELTEISELSRDEALRKKRGHRFFGPSGQSVVIATGHIGSISGLRLYDASRHSVASQLADSGVSLFQVSKILGHSSTRMTEKYSHADLESLKVQLSKLSLRKPTTITRLSPAQKTDKNNQ